MKRTDTLPVYPFGATSNQQPANLKLYGHSKVLFKREMICLLLIFLQLFSYKAFCQSFCGTDGPLNFEREPSSDFCSIFFVPITSPTICYPENNDLFIVRTFIHIVTDGNGQGGQSFQAINEALNIMIRDFAPHNITFSFTGVDYVKSNTYYSYNSGSHFNDLIKQDPHTDAIDIYFIPPGTYNGGRADPFSTAFVLGGGVTPNGTPITSTSLISHEMGHCLSLLHTFFPLIKEEETGEDGEILFDEDFCFSPFEDGCICGDFIPDTAYDPASYCYTTYDPVTNQCTYEDIPPLFIECEPEVLDIPYQLGITPPITNIMSYSPWECVNQFTEYQARRMKKYLAYCAPFQDVVETNTIRIASGLFIQYDVPFAGCLPNIDIEQGGRLTIASDRSFLDYKTINVKPGARLIVNGARLSGCEDDPWGGINVQGNKGLGQLPLSNQGYVALSNGAVIEKARNPLTVLNGGIVIAQNTDFLNCGASIFWPYLHGSKNNLSSFRNCQFTSDEDFNLPDFNYNVLMVGTKGIGFTNCHFTAPSFPNDYSKKIFAVGGLSAHFIVDGNTIEGYYQGIGAADYGFNPSAGFTVKNTRFTDNFIGIENWTVNMAIINDNIFEGIGSHPYHTNTISVAPRPAGVILRNCTAYQVTDNIFEGTQEGDALRIGILAYGTGTEPNIIKRNVFEGLNVANQAELLNRDIIDPVLGLQYWCNDNTAANNYDFYVFDEGIAGSQGGGKATLNKFSHHESVFGDFYNSGNNGITYYHDNSYTGTPQPGYYFGIAPVLAIENNNCSILGEDNEGKLGQEEELLFIQSFDNAKGSYDSLKIIYHSLLDGGDTEDLLTAVSGADSLTLGTVRQSLLNYSPYLTRQVLERVVGRDDLFPENSISAILSANPDELRHPSFQAWLRGELNQALVDSILPYSNQITSRSSMESMLASFKTDMHRFANRIIRSTLADTLTLDLPKLRSLLGKKESIESGYALVETYLWESDTTAARQWLDSLSLKYGLTSQQSTELNYYRDWTDIKIRIINDSLDWLALDSPLVQQIQSIADNNQGIASVQAQALLNFAYGFDYRIYPKVPGNGGSEGLILPPSKGKLICQILEQQQVVVYPNPAKESVTFEFTLPEGITSATLFLTDINGRHLKILPLAGQRGAVRLSVKDLPLGIYLYRLRYPDGISQPGKLVLTN